MPNLIEKIRDLPELATFLELLEKAELLTSLERDRNCTVFAPNDAAFASAPADILAEYYKRFYNTRMLLSHHIVVGVFLHGDLLALEKRDLPSTANTSLRVTDNYGIARVAGAKLIVEDMSVDNGVLHVIDRVLLPSQLLS